MLYTILAISSKMRSVDTALHTSALETLPCFRYSSAVKQ